MVDVVLSGAPGLPIPAHVLLVSTQVEKNPDNTWSNHMFFHSPNLTKKKKAASKTACNSEKIQNAMVRVWVWVSYKRSVLVIDQAIIIVIPELRSPG